MYSVQIDKNKFFSVFFFLLCARLIAMFFIPLNDSTEARYGEIARIMLETGDWVTPMQEYGVPFWAKPPLSTWLSGISMAIFGVNEFAARLPALLLSIGVLWLVWFVARLKFGIDFALVTCLVLASSFFFYLDAGVVMTDPALLFATSLTFFAFWLAVSEKLKGWGYAFFAALGLGMLAKGPVAWVLTGLPIGLWILINNKWQETWKNLPWFKGLLLTCLIFMPWYIIAEHKTPGFINYFIIGENINRFLKPGWEGDMYGGAHLAPHGYIWLYAFIGIFPWVIPLLGIFGKKIRQLLKFKLKVSEWTSFLLLCILTPLVFFTFASNIIYPYVFPILPFFALLFAGMVHDKFNSNYYIWMALSSGLIFLAITFLFAYKPILVEKSQKRMISTYNLYKKRDSKLIYWLPKADFSARFYSHGAVYATNDINLLRQYTSNKDNFIAINPKYIDDLPQDIIKILHEVFSLDVGNNKYILYKIS